MAGQIAEIARGTLRGEFRAIDPRAARVLLVEAGDRVLTTFPPRLSAEPRVTRAAGRDAVLQTTVVGVGAEGVDVQAAEARGSDHGAVGVWAAGVAASPLAGRWRPRPAAKPTARDASWSSPTSRSPATPRCSR